MTGAALFLREVFKDSYNYMKNGTLIRQVVNKINEIDFNRAEDRHGIRRHIRANFARSPERGQCGWILYSACCYFSSWWIWSIPNSVKNSLTLHAAREDSSPALSQYPNEICKERGRWRESPALHFWRREETASSSSVCYQYAAPWHRGAFADTATINTLARPLRDYGSSDRVDVIVTIRPWRHGEDGIESNFLQLTAQGRQQTCSLS